MSIIREAASAVAEARDLLAVIEQQRDTSMANTDAALQLVERMERENERLHELAFVMFKALQVAGGYTTLPPKLLDRIDAALAAYRDYSGAER